MSLLKWPQFRDGWEYVALACVLMLSLFGCASAYLIMNRQSTVQLFITHDAAQPQTDRIILKEITLGLGSGTDLTCDGASFKHGFPVQPLYVGIGRYVDVPALSPGQHYHCVFSSFGATRSLDIPAMLVPVSKILVPTSSAHVPLTQQLQVEFDNCGVNSGIWGSFATDASGHTVVSTSGGCGPTGNIDTFSQRSLVGLTPGPGSITTINQTIVDFANTGWHNVSVIYGGAYSIPVTWV